MLLLRLPLQYRDLPHDVQLGVTVCGIAEAQPRRVLGGATMRLFSKKGRLKDGPQTLRLSLGRAADLQSPTATPGKLPLAHRDNLGWAEFCFQNVSEILFRDSAVLRLH